ncbi:MAG TPA: M15 family metallopeptidase [Chitinophagaceae bacterium]
MLLKFSDRFSIYPAVIVIFLTGTVPLNCPAQDTTNKGPRVTTDMLAYQKQVALDSTKKLVELRSYVPGIIYDLRYTGANNFMQQPMYPDGTKETFLRLPAAIALAKVQAELNKKGWGLKVFDAYRPYSVTVKFWELVKDSRYVANPAKGSGHNRGVAIDVTLIDLQTGEEPDMGTGFDNFSDSAHHSFKKLPGDVLQNRSLLKNVMEKNGFKALDTEWWHYLFASWSRYELLDIDFRSLK